MGTGKREQSSNASEEIALKTLLGWVQSPEVPALTEQRKKGWDPHTPVELAWGKRKPDGASMIPWALPAGSTRCISPDASCQGGGEHVHLPIITNSWGVRTASAPFAPLVGMSPRGCIQYRAAGGPRLKITAPMNCSIAKQPSWEVIRQLHWACLKSTMQMLLRTLYKHKNSRNKTLWTIWKIQKSAFP